jgi:hypothetical protein
VKARHWTLTYSLIDITQLYVGKFAPLCEYFESASDAQQADPGVTKPDGSLSFNELACRLTVEGLPTISGSAAHVVYCPFRRQRACVVAENVGALLHTW